MTMNASPSHLELAHDLAVLLRAQLDGAAARETRAERIAESNERVHGWLDDRATLEDGRRVSPALVRVLLTDLAERLVREDGLDPAQLDTAQAALAAGL